MGTTNDDGRERPTATVGDERRRIAVGAFKCPSWKYSSMAEDSDHTDADVDSARRTAPMSEFTNRDVAIGFLVFLVGAVIVFGLPLAV